MARRRGRGTRAVTDWEARYGEVPNLFGDRPSDLLVREAARIVPGARALVIGDGEGRNGVWLAGRGARVLSTDVSPTALTRAHERALEAGVPLMTLCVDALDWAWPQAYFDLVVLIFVHFPPAARRQVYGSMIAALRPGGLAMVEVFHRDQAARDSGGPSDPALLGTVEELREAFASCELLRLERVVTDVEQAGVCQGQGDALHLVARKPSQPPQPPQP